MQARGNLHGPVSLPLGLTSPCQVMDTLVALTVRPGVRHLAIRCTSKVHSQRAISGNY